MSDEMNRSNKNRPGPGGRGPAPKAPGPTSGLFFWVLISALLALVVYAVMDQTRKARREEISLTAFYDSMDTISTAKAGQDEVVGKYRAPAAGKAEEYRVRIKDDILANLDNRIKAYNDEAQKNGKPRIDFVVDPGNTMLQVILINFLPVLLIVGVLWYILARQFRGPGGAGGVLNFGKARVRLHTKETSTITFDQVAGIDEAREEVQEVVEFLKNPPKFRRLGGRIPRGLLLVGPPGTGKTLLAKAIAGEAEVPFFSISGSDFIEMFVGVGASRVRDLFQQAKENAPCIMFLDEIDAVGRRRAVDLQGASAEGAQTLNAILVEMDGFETDDTIIVIAATNRPDVLDPALMRPGRFDRQIVVDMPDIRGREAILRVHARKYKLSSDVDLNQLARGTPMFSGADLEALLNEAALLATRKDKKAIDMADLEEARDKVRWGRERRSRALTLEDRQVTAYHESGHAIVARHLPDAEPLHKVSIIPQGMALGLTMMLPERDRYHFPRRRMLAQMTILLAGRAAEEALCDDITSGARQDIEGATELARMMVCQWGMSDQMGPVSYHESEEAFLGHERIRSRIYSEATAVRIDNEIRRLVQEAHEKATASIREHKDELERMSQALLKYEVLYAADIDAVVEGREIVRPEPNGTTAPKPTAPKPPDPEKQIT